MSATVKVGARLVGSCAELASNDHALDSQCRISELAKDEECNTRVVGLKGVLVEEDCAAVQVGAMWNLSLHRKKSRHIDVLSGVGDTQSNTSRVFRVVQNANTFTTVNNGINPSGDFSETSELRVLLLRAVAPKNARWPASHVTGPHKISQPSAQNRQVPVESYHQRRVESQSLPSW